MTYLAYVTSLRNHFQECKAILSFLSFWNITFNLLGRIVLRHTAASAVRSSLTFSDRASLLGKVGTTLMRTPSPLKLGFWDLGGKLRADLGPIESPPQIWQHSPHFCLLNLLSASYPCAFFSFPQSLAKPYSKMSVNHHLIELEFASQSQNLLVPGPSPLPPHYIQYPKMTSQPPWWKKTFQSSFINEETHSLFFQGTKKRTCYEWGKLLVGHWSGQWNLNIDN